MTIAITAAIAVIVGWFTRFAWDEISGHYDPYPPVTWQCSECEMEITYEEAETHRDTHGHGAFTAPVDSGIWELIRAGYSVTPPEPARPGT